MKADDDRSGHVRRPRSQVSVVLRAKPDEDPCRVLDVFASPVLSTMPPERSMVGRGLGPASAVISPRSDFDAFFVEHYERLVRALTAMTGDRELARDSVQDAFVKASARWRRISRYDDPVGWVRRVAINRSRDLHRADRRRRRREDRVSVGEAIDEPDRSADVDGALHIEELFGALPTQQRRVAGLFYVESLSVAEVAATLGLSPGTVKFHLNQARATLRTVIVEEGQRHG